MKDFKDCTKNGTKDARSQFSPYLNKKVHCKGEFAGINIGNGNKQKTITILFHNVVLNDEIPCDHVWVFYNKNFNRLDIKFGCVMEFDAVVQKYKHEERLGISDCSNIRIISDGIDGSNDELSFRINTIKYDNQYLQKFPGGKKMPAHIAFLKEFNIKSGTRVTLKYSEEQFKNSAKVFLDMYVDGKKVDGRVYFDSDNKYGIVAGKYFLPVKEQNCRQLSLFYLRNITNIAA